MKKKSFGVVYNMYMEHPDSIWYAVVKGRQKSDLGMERWAEYLYSLHKAYLRGDLLFGTGGLGVCC